MSHLTLKLKLLMAAALIIATVAVIAVSAYVFGNNNTTPTLSTKVKVLSYPESLVTTAPSAPESSAGGLVFSSPMANCPSYSLSRGYSRMHTGVDFAAPQGCPVVSVAAGKVLRAGEWCPGGLGYCVVVQHNNGYSSLYGHMNGKFFVKVGDEIVAGQELGEVGCTGNCTGSQLHFSLSKSSDDIINCYNCRIDPDNPEGIVVL